jgi:hypothetical protein
VQSRNRRPPGDGEVLLYYDNQPKKERKDERTGVPMPGCLFVLHHRLLMAILEIPGTSFLDTLVHVLAPEESDMSDQTTELTMG